MLKQLRLSISKIMLSSTVAALSLGGVHSGCSTASSGEIAETEAASNLFSFARPPAEAITVPVGTLLKVRTTTSLSTNTNSEGETFVGHLASPLLAGDKTVAEEGAEVWGRVTASNKGGRVKGRAQIIITLESLETINGKVELETSDYVVTAKKTIGKDAQKIGIGAGVGAAIGAIAGGGGGAAKGAGLGAGAGTGAVLATRGDAAVLPAESVIPFQLDAPISIAD